MLIGIIGMSLLVVAYLTTNNSLNKANKKIKELENQNQELLFVLSDEGKITDKQYKTLLLRSNPVMDKFWKRKGNSFLVPSLDPDVRTQENYKQCFDYIKSYGHGVIITTENILIDYLSNNFTDTNVKYTFKYHSHNNKKNKYKTIVGVKFKDEKLYELEHADFDYVLKKFNINEWTYYDKLNIK